MKTLEIINQTLIVTMTIWRLISHTVYRYDTCFLFQFGQQVYVVGSSARLGGWNPAGALPLSWGQGNVWNGSAVLSTDGKRPTLCCYCIHMCMCCNTAPHLNAIIFRCSWHLVLLFHCFNCIMKKLLVLSFSCYHWITYTFINQNSTTENFLPFFMFRRSGGVQIRFDWH